MSACAALRAPASSRPPASGLSGAGFAAARAFPFDALAGYLDSNLPADVLSEAFSRLQPTYDPLHAALNSAAQQAFEDGFLGRQMPDLSGLYDLTLLNEVLAEKKRKAMQ